MLYVSSIPTSGWYVNVHRGTMLATQTGFDPISCGNVHSTIIQLVHKKLISMNGIHTNELFL